METKTQNLSRLEPDSVRASTKEDSQRTTTLTDNKNKRDYENKRSSMHEDSCIGINYAHIFTKCFTSLHTLLGFALYSVSSIQICRCTHLFNFLNCTRIPCRDSHCENVSFEVLSLHTPSVAGDRRQLKTIQLQQNREQLKKSCKSLV